MHLAVYDQAQRHLRVADHILNVTHPLIQDPKLLLGVIDNLYLALNSALRSLLLYDCARKSIPPFIDNQEARLRMFQVKSMPLHHIPEDFLVNYFDLRELIRRHKTSSVEFRRKDRFIICTPGYELTIVTVATMRTYIIKTKQFVDMIGGIVDERISRRGSRRTEAR